MNNKDRVPSKDVKHSNMATNNDGMQKSRHALG
jgi:hypothetical protein